MAPIWCGPSLLPLFLWVMACSQVSSEGCDVPSRIDQEFCTSFYSICLSTPNRKCLAESASQCVDDVGFPINVIVSLKNFINRFIWETNQSKPATPSATPTPHYMSFPPTSIRQPFGSYFISLPALPPIAMPPQRMPPQTMPPQTMPPQTMPPQTMPPQTMPPQTMPPQTMPPQTMPPQTMPPQTMPPQTMPPQTMVRWEMTPIKRPTNYNIGHYGGSIDQIYSTTYQNVPFVSTDQSYVIMPPMIRPPTTTPPTPVPVDVDNEYFRYLVLLLESLHEQQIQTVVRLALEENHPPAHVLVEGSTQIVDVDSVVQRLFYLIQQYSYYQIDATYLESYLKQLLESSVELYDWIALVIDNIYTTLEIEPESAINYEHFLSSLGPYDGSIDQTYNFDIPGYNSGSYEDSSGGLVGYNTERFGNLFYNIFSTTQTQRLSLGYCHGNVPHSADCEKYCTNDYGGNWIAVQTHERSQDSRAFDTYFDDYVRGFGSLETGYWMGLECLTVMTQTKPHELLIELTDAMGNTAIAHYEYFSVGDAQSGYELHLGKYKGGAAGDSLRISDGMKFTTKDRDFDGYRGNCAVTHKGGWWYHNCQKLGIKNFLNGDFASDEMDENVNWNTWETLYSIYATRVFIREIEVYLG